MSHQIKYNDAWSVLINWHVAELKFIAPSASSVNGNFLGFQLIDTDGETYQIRFYITDNRNRFCGIFKDEGLEKFTELHHVLIDV